jgi:hypothetical protein
MCEEVRVVQRLSPLLTAGLPLPSPLSVSGYHGVHPAVLHGPGGLFSYIAPRKTFTRNRRQAKRETRIWEKEERRRRMEIEDKKKRKALEHFRALLAHREEFFRFHKNKRIGEYMPG